MYFKICGVEIKHDFFLSGYLRNKSICPSHETANNFRNYDLLLQPTGRGFNISCNQDRMLDIIDSNLKKEIDLNLYFDAFINDANYFNYTTLKDKDKFFVYKNTKGSKLTPKENENPPNLNKSYFIFSIDLNIKLTKSFIEKQQSKDFYIDLKSRKTYWKYFVLTKENNLSFSIKDADNKHIFSLDKTSDLSFSNNAYVFSSKTPIAFKEVQNFKFELIDEKRSKSILKDLAHADPSKIYSDNNSKLKKECSYIFINL